MSHICKVASRFIVLFCISFGILDAGAAFAQQRQYTRPGAKTGPTIVSVSIWVIDIDSINSAEQNFVANVFVALRWKDDRLARRGGQEYKVDYLPAESNTGMFGGNSNLRGPIWMPVNVLLIRGLLSFYLYYGDSFKIECPTGSGNMIIRTSGTGLKSYTSHRNQYLKRCL